uniref:5'-nucleotidase domain-containing protein 1 n=1 Tax=Graphocephala atropunctata TaxID=36148 RepID=A0A1B6LFR7_9HEMI
MQFFSSGRILNNSKISRSTLVNVNRCSDNIRVWLGYPISIVGIPKWFNRTFSSFHVKNVGNVNSLVCFKKTSQLMMSTFVSKPTLSPQLRLGEYDCIGFDLDNTLCEYNISSNVGMEYSILAKFLVEEKGYDPHHLLQPLDSTSHDFIQKGLVIDFAHGNLLKIGENGLICRASHGTKAMTLTDIVNTYGSERRWEVTSEFCKNMIIAWEGPLSERMRALFDYFDMPASLAFARIIDSLDQKLGQPADIYNVWPDVKAGLCYMYSRENFKKNEGYFKEMRSNPQKFIKKCNPALMDWLKSIKESKVTFLITGSNCDFASMTAETCLGKNWRSLFDVVVCFARKPGFFTGCRPFIELNGLEETNPIDGNALKFGEMYSQGNWQELYQLFGRNIGKKEPRCLYFGDNLIQDVYAPSEYTKCDTVAVVEELSVESSDKYVGHPSEAFLTSHFWGSFFFDDQEKMNTVWGGIVKRYSKLCIPNLSAIADHSVNYEFSTFCKGPTDGYFPTYPATIDSKTKTDSVQKGVSKILPN